MSKITPEQKAEIEKHFYWQVLNNTEAVTSLRTHISLLEKRIEYLQQSMSSKTPFEANEAEILIIATKPEIKAKKDILDMRVNYNYNFMLDFIPKVKDMEQNYDALLEKAERKRKYNAELEKTLASVNWEAVKTDLEVKVMLFDRLKKMV